MLSFINKLQNLIKLLKNCKKMKVKTGFLFYVYINPPVYFVLAIFAKFLIFTKNKKIINFFLEKKIFISVIRLLSIEEKKFVSKILSSYNTFSYGNENTSDKLKELENNGYCSLGKIFSDEEFDKFIRNLDKKNCFNNQTVLQSDGIKKVFELNNEKNYGKQSNYYCFLPEVVMDFQPVKNFLLSEKLKKILQGYLNFNSSIYHCITFFNPPSNHSHYVQTPHRDYDDWKHVQLTIYWNNINQKNGAMTYYKKSHKTKFDKNNKVELNGVKGEVQLIDTYGMHSANIVTEGSRYITFIRFAKYTNKLSVVDGFLSSPKQNNSQTINK